jgi:hypothetical protein
MHKKPVLFFRHYRRFQGGHLKAWNYFGHVLASPHYTPCVWFSAGTTLDAESPWRDAEPYRVPPQAPIRPAAFFLGGRNWRMLDRYPYADLDIPVINLIQHVRHADDEAGTFEFLHRQAIRICVSDEVAEAVRATGIARGPIVAIPNALDLPDLGLVPATETEPRLDAVIVALKAPELGERVAERMRREGRRLDLLTERLPRAAFLSRMQSARVSVLLPREQEGFYLPALEAMALGTLVVCPDCVGNRSFCLPGENAFRPGYTIDEIVAAAEEALALTAPQAKCMRERASATAAAHSLERERRAFLDVLHTIDDLWRRTDAGSA